MEAPRLRLIILGSLRGLVKPGYKFGITSFIREELLLHAMQREIDGQTFLMRGLVESSLTGAAAPGHKHAIYAKAVDYLMQGNSLNKGSSYKSLKKARLSVKDEFSIRQAVAAFKILKRTNFYDIMAATLNAELQQRR